MSVLHANPRRKYRALLMRSESEFLSQLGDNIMQGPSRQEDVLRQLDLLESHDLTHLLLKFRPHGDDNLLQLAAIFHGDVTVMTRLATLCPRLLAQQRQGQYQGQNVLHTLVSKQNVAGARAILTHPRLLEPRLLLNGKAVGPGFAGTVMMGELPLSVAALTFNLDMVDALLGEGARLEEVNSRGDTLLHSLLRYTHLHPRHEPQVAAMMRDVHTRLQAPGAAPSPQAEPRCVWLMENNEGLTALRLAAALALPSLFQLVLQLEGVYCQLDRHDGLFDSLLYDVTEIDPVAQQRWREVNRRRPPRSGSHGVAPLGAYGLASPTHPSMKEAGCWPGKDAPAPSAMQRREERGRFVSVLEILCETGHVDRAFEMINTYVVRSIVKAKWRHYFGWFLIWAAVHLLLMSLLTTHAIFKARLIQKAQEEATTTSPPPPTTTTNFTTTTTTTTSTKTAASLETEEVFVKVMAVVGVVVAGVAGVMEGLRWRRGMSLYLWLIHHNGLYRLQLVIWALAVMGDSLWYWIAGPVNNFFLILALLVGWWFCTFFLRPWRKFSFFTVMLQKVLLGDMLRFSAIILLELLAFSVAMYVTFLPTPGGCPEEFRHLGVTLLTLFKLMLGLGEVEVLGEAPHPWLSTLLFVLFVVLTYLLMLNALIAMMSNTCSLVSENKLSQWELQRLSVVLLLESMLPCSRLLLNSGRPLYVASYDLRRKEMVQETRYFTKVTSVQTSYTESGAAILKRKSMMQTQRFDDFHALMTSVGDVVTSTSNVMTSVAHLDLLASFTHQQALLSMSGGYGDEGSQSRSASSESVGYGLLPLSSENAHHSAFKASPKPKERGAGLVRHRTDLPAIKEREESGPVSRPEGQGEGESYVSVRQTLMKALLAARTVGHLSSAHSHTHHQHSPHSGNLAQHQPSHYQHSTHSGNVAQLQPSQCPDRHLGSSQHLKSHPEENVLSGDTAAGRSVEETQPSPLPLPKSPHTPKSVRLTVQAPEKKPPPFRFPPAWQTKTAQQRENSEKGTASG